VRAAPGKEYRIKLRRDQEAFEAQGYVLGGTHSIEFVGLDHDSTFNSAAHPVSTERSTPPNMPLEAF
jgi:hypothetical protein